MTCLKRAWPAIAALAWPLWPAWAQSLSPATESAEQAAARQQWRDANERVGEFPRGHIDLLRWERQNLTAAQGEPAAVAPLTADEVLRRSLALRPELWGPPATNPLVALERRQTLRTHIADVQRLWLDAVLAAQSTRWQQARSDIADQGAELGRRMVAAGNWSQARQMREQVTQANEALALLQARKAERSALERLALAMGLDKAEDIAGLARRLPAELPEPPEAPPARAAGEVEAAVVAADRDLERQRLETGRQVSAVPADLRRQRAEAIERSLADVTASQPPAELPAIDARLARDHALNEAAEAEASLRRAEAERRSQAREAWARVLDQHAQARQTQTVLLPLVIAQEQETQLRYNGMLQSTWELLDATRERLAATRSAAQARHGYWVALADWQLLEAGGPYRASDTDAPPAAAGSAPKDH